MQSLNTDVLIMIFNYCLSDGGSRISEREAPFNISYVCRRWRTEALGAWRLWANLHLVCGDDSSVERKVLPALAEYLPRSDPACISIKLVRTMVRVPARYSREPTLQSLAGPVTVQKILKVLHLHTSRLKSFSIDVEGSKWYSMLSDIKSFSSLEKLSLSLQEDIEALNGTFQIMLLRLRKTVTTLELGGTMCLHSGVSISFKHIRSLTLCLRFKSPNVLDCILKCCPSLEELRIKPSDGNVTICCRHALPFLHEVVTYPRMETFELSGVGMADHELFKMLQRAHFPNLLRFSLDTCNAKNFLTILMAFFRRSSNLEEIYIKDAKVSRHDLDESFRILPHLKVLEVDPIRRKLT